MFVKLILDHANGQYTNLDLITGRVVFNVTTNTTVSHITVKLEGESRTRLLSPPRPGTNERPRPSLEIHKLLYKVVRVFPPDNSPAGGNPNFILNPGQYSYPFGFKIPFNNACNPQNTISTNLNFAGLSLEVAKTPRQHVKTTLPPSIYFPGEAEIRYYLKVTINRPSLLKENPRAFTNLTFNPIEPPRPQQDGETYARRQHQFIQDNFPGMDRKGSGVTLFPKLARKSSVPSSSPVSPSPTSPSLINPPARFSIDARLPNPAILTCGQDIPLRMVFKQLSERSEPISLETLQIELVGYTLVRAHDAMRTETNGWVLCSLSNIHQPIGEPSDPVGKETELSKEFWYGQRLPETVAPSFVTCNISRKYELVVSAGLAYGRGANQFIVLPLRLNVEIYSGIKPPPELLKRLEEAPPNKPVGGSALPQYPGPSQQPMQAGSVLPPQTVPGYDDAPPSYEDAIASDLPPIDGPRPHYRPPPAPEGESRITDEKR